MKDKRQLMIMITMLTVVYNAKEVAAGPAPELLANMGALTTSIQTMQVGQQRTDPQQQQNQQQLHNRAAWGNTLRAAHASAAHANAVSPPTRKSRADYQSSSKCLWCG
jgi:hypothetical protein